MGVHPWHAPLAPITQCHFIVGAAINNTGSPLRALPPELVAAASLISPPPPPTRHPSTGYILYMLVVPCPFTSADGHSYT